MLQGPRVRHERRVPCEQRVDTMLERFGLERGRRPPRHDTYSGGMQRKLDVAMGLVHRPEVLFLDEPTTGLDPEARADMWTEIERLANDEGLTILLTTHYLEEADGWRGVWRSSTRARSWRDGTPDELKSELHGDAMHVELERARDRRRGRRGAGPDRRTSTTSSPRAACCTRAPTTAPAPCRWCCRPWRPTASPSPRSPSRGPRSTTSI